MSRGAAAATIGGSYIGCELAATLTSLGVKCSILMQEDVVLVAAAL